jgi:hypothetical protein
MPRWLLAAAAAGAALLALGVASQLALPPLAEHRAESELTRDGGTATASISAVPAVRLLFGDGDRISMSGTGLSLPFEQPSDSVFSKLDGFDEVSVSLRDSETGPFSIASFELSRPSSASTYHLVAVASTTPGDLAESGASSMGIPGAPLLGLLSGQVPEAGKRIPVDLDMELRSDDGRIIVVSGGGTVAGIPTGPLAELITSAVVLRL